MDSTAKFQCTSHLRVTCISACEFSLELRGERISGGAYSLAVLDAFRVPRSIAEAMVVIRPRITGIREWMDLTQQIVQFQAAGVLQPVDGGSTRVLGDGNKFGAPAVHISMLSDRTRTRSYLDAIRATVRPGDVVVDLGTGTGVLSIAAAKAGARHVYAIEASEIAAVARACFEVNGVADRITLLEGLSTEIELPEKADVLVAEIIGSDPLAERILEFTADGVRRFLKPDARLLPSRLRVYGLPVETPAAVRDLDRVSDSALVSWKEDYGIDFSPFALFSRRSPNMGLFGSVAVSKWPALASSELLAEFDLSLTLHKCPQPTARFHCTRDGQFDALVLWFEADLGTDQSTLSTNPAWPRTDNSWHHAVHRLANPLTLQAGMSISIRFTGEVVAKLES